MGSIPPPFAMASHVPFVSGDLSSCDDALDFAREVSALMHRYARDVVFANRLCPFLEDVNLGLGAVSVVLDRKLDVPAAARAVRATGSRLVHLVFPCTLVDPAVFERFGNDVAGCLRTDGNEPLVHATFHPRMVGGADSPHRLARLFRRSPDPLLQFIPDGILQGGTTFAGTAPSPPSPLAQTFARLTVDDIARIVATQDALIAERSLRYARFAPDFGPFFDA